MPDSRDSIDFPCARQRHGPALLSEGAAISSAAAGAIGNVLAGRATADSTPARVLLVTSSCALSIILVAAAIVGGSPSGFDLLMGLCAGACGGMVLPLAYRALALGPIGVVTPLITCVSTFLVTTVAIALGHRPHTSTILGLALCLLAVIVMNAQRGAGVVSHLALAYALIAGIGFGLFVSFMDRAASTSGLWPLVAARVSISAVAIVLTGLTWRSTQSPRGRARLMAVGSGMSESVGNVLLIIALSSGDIVVVAAIGALSPLFAALLARVMTRERLIAAQWVGLALAVLGTALAAR